MSLRSFVVALALACGLLVAPASHAWDADYGRAWRGDGVLRDGCHDYRFRYRIRPAHDDWMLELRLVGPGGVGLWHTTKTSDVDPERAREAFEICRYTTRPGRFRIRGRLTMYDDGSVLPGDEVEIVKWIRPAKFRLRRPS